MFINNSYLGQVRWHSIMPPSAVLQLKQCAEGLTNFASSTLYLCASNQPTMDNGDCMPEALVFMMDNSIELVVKIAQYYMGERTIKADLQAQYSTKSTSTILFSGNLLILFQFISASIWKMGPLSQNRPSKLMLIAFHILHTLKRTRYNLDALIWCISYVEEFPHCIWHQLFPDIVSESPMDDPNVWGMQASCSDSVLESPLTFVKSAAMEQHIETRSHYTDCL